MTDRDIASPAPATDRDIPSPGADADADADEENLRTAFIPYASLTKHGAKQERIWRRAGMMEPDVRWVAMEKIHGANFALQFRPRRSAEQLAEAVAMGLTTEEAEAEAQGATNFCTDADADGILLLQRRNGLLYDKEAFHGTTAKDSKLTASLAPGVVALGKHLQPKVGVAVFGELYGGSIQPEIFYSKEVHFVCFDILVDRNLLAYDRMSELCENFGIPFAKPLLEGAYDDIVNRLDLETLVSPCSLAHDETPPDGKRLPADIRIAEGIVLRHRDAEGGRRPILKKKRRAFLEVRAPKEKAAPKDKRDRGLPAERIADFVTEGRLFSVRPKFDTRTTPANTIIAAVVEDAHADIVKAPEWADLDEGARKAVRGQLWEAARQLRPLIEAWQREAS